MDGAVRCKPQRQAMLTCSVPAALVCPVGMLQASTASTASTACATCCASSATSTTITGVCCNPCSPLRMLSVWRLFVGLAGLGRDEVTGRPQSRQPRRGWWGRVHGSAADQAACTWCLRWQGASCGAAEEAGPTPARLPGLLFGEVSGHLEGGCGSAPPGLLSCLQGAHAAAGTALPVALPAGCPAPSPSVCSSAQGGRGCSRLPCCRFPGLLTTCFYFALKWCSHEPSFQVRPICLCCAAAGLACMSIPAKCVCGRVQCAA